MKHTPGPWKVNQHPLNGSIQIMASTPTKLGDLPVVAELGGSTVMTARKELANANLIAAAPEMLQLLEYVRDYIVDLDLKGFELIKGDLRKTIAKAKGGA